MIRMIPLCTITLIGVLGPGQPALGDAVIGGQVVDCYCTGSSGERLELGEIICLHVDGKMFMAQCQMSLNVPMWRKISDGCLSSSLDQTSRPREPDKKI